MANGIGKKRKQALVAVTGLATALALVFALPSAISDTLALLDRMRGHVATPSVSGQNPTSSAQPTAAQEATAPQQPPATRGPGPGTGNGGGSGGANSPSPTKPTTPQPSVEQRLKSCAAMAGIDTTMIDDGAWGNAVSGTLKITGPPAKVWLFDTDCRPYGVEATSGSITFSALIGQIWTAQYSDEPTPSISGGMAFMPSESGVTYFFGNGGKGGGEIEVIYFA